MIFGNPLRGTIHPHSWSRPAGNLDFRVTQPFGCTGVEAERPFGSCAHFHRAIDLGNGHCGADVLAAAAGTVRSSMLLNGSNVVVIDHGGGNVTGYAHLASRSVAKGAKVSKGQKVGTLGSTGATACHLHFAVKKSFPSTGSFWEDGAANGTWVDPWPHLAQNVTVHPDPARVANIRTSAGSSTSPAGPVHSTSKAGRIHRASDGTDLGATIDARKWGGEVTGAGWTIDDVAGRTWEKLWLDGAWRFIATRLAIRSAS